MEQHVPENTWIVNCSATKFGKSTLKPKRRDSQMQNEKVPKSLAMTYTKHAPVRTIRTVGQCNVSIRLTNEGMPYGRFSYRAPYIITDYHTTY